MIYEPCIILKPEVVSIHPTARIDSFCKIEGGQGVAIGAHVHIASFSHINGGGGTVVFGAHSGCASGAKIIGGLPDIAYQHISAAEPAELCHVIRRVTTIGEYVLIGTNAVILPGVTVGDGAVIGAGAVVTRDVEPWSIVVGVPAQVIGKREVSKR